MDLVEDERSKHTRNKECLGTKWLQVREREEGGKSATMETSWVLAAASTAEEERRRGKSGGGEGTTEEKEWGSGVGAVVHILSTAVGVEEG